MLVVFLFANVRNVIALFNKNNVYVYMRVEVTTNFAVNCSFFFCISTLALSIVRRPILFNIPLYKSFLTHANVSLVNL